MAHKKAGGSTALGRDSQGQRLGVKVGHGDFATAGSIIVRQRGTPIRAGKNVSRGNDDSLFAMISGIVKFTTRKMRRFTGDIKTARYVSVSPKE